MRFVEVIYVTPDKAVTQEVKREEIKPSFLYKAFKDKTKESKSQVVETKECSEKDLSFDSILNDISKMEVNISLNEKEPEPEPELEVLKEEKPKVKKEKKKISKVKKYKAKPIDMALMNFGKKIASEYRSRVTKVTGIPESDITVAHYKTKENGWIVKKLFNKNHYALIDQDQIIVIKTKGLFKRGRNFSTVKLSDDGKNIVRKDNSNEWSVWPVTARI